MRPAFRPFEIHRYRNEPGWRRSLGWQQALVSLLVRDLIVAHPPKELIVPVCPALPSKKCSNPSLSPARGEALGRSKKQSRESTTRLPSWRHFGSVTNQGEHRQNHRLYRECECLVRRCASAPEWFQPQHCNRSRSRAAHVLTLAGKDGRGRLHNPRQSSVQANFGSAGWSDEEGSLELQRRRRQLPCNPHFADG